MSVTVGQILDLLEKIAPIEFAEEWDNVGLLAGRHDAKVTCVLCALDLNQKVLDEAISLGAQMIVAHHPILFHARRNLREDDPEGKLLSNLVRSGIAFAAMHTNFDNAHPGVNDVLAKTIGLKDIEPRLHGICIGNIAQTTLKDTASMVGKQLGGAVRVYGDPDTVIERVAVLGGSGGDYVQYAIEANADLFVTGEIGYHMALSAVEEGLCVIEAGHAATENPAISFLSGGLQNAANDVQYKVRVLCSAQGLFL